VAVIRSVIRGVGAHLPKRVMTNDDLARLVDTSDDWIKERTGIEQRHIAEPGELTSDLGIAASRQAIVRAGIDPVDVDLVICATATPDRTFPATAVRIQSGLGVTKGAAFDVQAVCSGFIYALAVADNFIKAGQSRRAVVVGAETFSRILDWEDRGTCVLFGDGAGAVVLKRSDTPGILAAPLHADGSQAAILSVPGSVCGGKVSGRPLLQMDGTAVFKFAVRVLEEVALEALAEAGLQKSDIDWLIPHQANIRILQATAKKLDLPMERVITTVDRHANTSAASVPLALDEAVRDGRIRPGQHVMLEGVGGGFTWGAVLIKW
jgi:3-oxoacyl-[acyl-carrier-protein] synthase-3